MTVIANHERLLARKDCGADLPAHVRNPKQRLIPVRAQVCPAAASPAQGQHQGRMIPVLRLTLCAPPTASC